MHQPADEYQPHRPFARQLLGRAEPLCIHAVGDHADRHRARGGLRQLGQPPAVGHHMGRALPQEADHRPGQPMIQRQVVGLEPGHVAAAQRDHVGHATERLQNPGRRTAGDAEKRHAAVRPEFPGHARQGQRRARRKRQHLQRGTMVRMAPYGRQSPELVAVHHLAARQIPIRGRDHAHHMPQPDQLPGHVRRGIARPAPERRIFVIKEEEMQRGARGAPFLGKRVSPLALSPPKNF